MKKIYLKAFLFGFSVLLLSSCGIKYQYYQVYNLTPTQETSNKISTKNDSYLYKNDDCTISYYFWGENGNTAYSIRNNTNSLMKLKLLKSFYIYNDFAQPLAQDRVWSESVSSATSATIGATGTRGIYETVYPNIYGKRVVSSSISASASLSNTIGNASGVSVKEDTIMYIPPKCTAIVNRNWIRKDCYRECGFNRFPADSSKVSFNEESSPIVIGDYLSYSIDGEIEKNIDNRFYVNEITNYSMPAFIEMEERPQPCPNINKSKKDYTKVYYKVTKINKIGKFYIPYESDETKKKLYDPGDLKNYIYSEEHDGYIYNPSMSNIK